MITVEAALDIVRSHALQPDTEKIPLTEAAGRVLREPLLADRDFPPFDRVTMDGIALSYTDFAGGQRKFPISGVGAAGAPQQRLSQPGTCIEIMTGAMLPAGTDSVIRYEDVVISDGIATVQIDEIQQGQNIHRKGHDRAAASLIVPPGKLISAAEIGVGATIGKTELEVSRRLSALILSSGDELVEVSQKPLPHQIRRSNSYTLQVLLQARGVQAQTAHVPDDPQVIEALLAEHLPQYDVLLLSGGVSMGKFDYIPAALEALGVKKYFHKVAQRPGKPFWFGRIPDSTVVFALPGNPVSSVVCTMVYFGEWLDHSLGQAPRPSKAQLTRDVIFRPNLSYFMQVRLHTTTSGQIMAEPVEGHGSGDLANLVDADAFLLLPQGRDHFAAGEAFSFWRFR